MATTFHSVAANISHLRPGMGNGFMSSLLSLSAEGGVVFAPARCRFLSRRPLAVDLVRQSTCRTNINCFPQINSCRGSVNVFLALSNRLEGNVSYVSNS
jgi:hypothetical protein